MADKKWDRFKRLFGAESSDELIAIRLGKVNAAIQRIIDAVTNMQGRGLPTMMMNAGRIHLEQRRQVAVNLANNRQKAPVLATLKRDARQAAAQAETTAEQAIATLDSELETRRKAVTRAISGPGLMRCPLVVSLLATPVQQLTQARDNAEQQTTDHRKRNALNAIDETVVTQLLARLKPLNTDYGQAKNALKQIGYGFTTVPSVRQPTTWAGRRSALQVRFDKLTDEKNVDNALIEAAALRVDTAAFREDVDKEVLIYEGEVLALGSARRKVQTAIDRAEGIAHKMGTAVVASTLRVVKRDQQLAEQKVGMVAITKALEEIDLASLIDAIIASADLDLGVPALMAAIPALIKLVDSKSTQLTLTERLSGLTTRLDTANDEADLGEAKTLFASLKTDATKLMDDAIAAGGEDAFKTALETRFGLEVAITEGAIVDLERTYRMMELVPESHVGHDKCKTVNFEPKPKDGAVGSYGGGTINMKGMSPEKTDTYELDGETHKPNLFSVTMLHEIGHAVDDQYSIMKGLQANAGYGKWKAESRESVHLVIKTACISEMGDLDETTTTKVDEAIGLALKGKEIERPDGISSRQWKALQKYAGIADQIRDAKQPYFNDSIGDLAIGGRVYLEAYSKSNRWWSFELTERSSQRVNNYQWRAPGEWFAEIYAICWMKNKSKPTGVGAGLDRWLPQA